MTLAAILSLPGDGFRLVVFRPGAGVRECADAWVELEGPHHQILARGRRADDWRRFCDAAGIELRPAC